MLRKLILQNLIAYQSRGLAAQAKAATKEKYDIFAGVLIERLPIVSKKFKEIENEVLVRIFHNKYLSISLKSCTILDNVEESRI